MTVVQFEIQSMEEKRKNKFGKNQVITPENVVARLKKRIATRILFLYYNKT